MIISVLIFLQPLQVSIEEKLAVESLPYVIPDTFPDIGPCFRNFFIKQYLRMILDDFEEDIKENVDESSYIYDFFNEGKIRAHGKDSIVLYYYKKAKNAENFDVYLLYSGKWQDTAYISYLKLIYGMVLFLRGEDLESERVIKGLSSSEPVIEKWKGIILSMIDEGEIPYRGKYVSLYNKIIRAIHRRDYDELQNLLSSGDLPYTLKLWCVVEECDFIDDKGLLLKYIQEDEEDKLQRQFYRIVRFIKAYINFHRTFDESILGEFVSSIPDTTDMIFEISFILSGVKSGNYSFLSPGVLSSYIDNLKPSRRKGEWHSILSYIVGIVWYRLGEVDRAKLNWYNARKFSKSLWSDYSLVAEKWLDMEKGIYEYIEITPGKKSLTLLDFINLYNGMVAFYKKDLPKALKFYREVRHNPRLKGLALWYTSMVYEWQNNIKEAIEILEDLYDSYRERRPYIIERIVYLSSQMEDSLSMEIAERWYSEFVKLYGEGESYEDVYARIVVILFDMHRKRNGSKISYFLELLKTRLGRMDIVESYYYEKFLNSISIEDKKFYIEGLEKVYNRSNYLPEMYFSMGIDYLKDKKYKEAVFYLEKVKKWEKVDVIKDILPELYFRLGFSYFALENFDEAINNFSIYYNFYKEDKYLLKVLWLYGKSLMIKGERLREAGRSYESYRKYYSKAIEIFRDYIKLEKDEAKVKEAKELIDQCEVFLR